MNKALGGGLFNLNKALGGEAIKFEQCTRVGGGH